MSNRIITAAEIRIGDVFQGAEVFDVTPLQHDPGRVVISVGRRGIGFAIVLDASAEVPVEGSTEQQQAA